MADTFEITGKNTISFAAGNRWQLTADSRPRGMSKPLSDQAVLNELRNLPLEIRPHALQHGLSKIAFTFDINGSTGADMEDALHDLLETLEEGALYISSRGARGTKAVLHYKKAGAAADSYKTMFYGDFDEAGARPVLGAEQMNHQLIAMPLTLYCEPYWHPAATTNLVNAVTVYNHDDADVGHDNFVDIAAANIKGDVEARIRLRAKSTCVPGYGNWMVEAARRTRGTPSSLIHVREAESFPALTNWTVTPDVDCSNGSKLLNNGVATSGNAAWAIDPPTANNMGRFRVLGCVKTNDVTNTKWRFGYKTSTDQAHIVSDWEHVLSTANWQWVDFGVMNFDPFVRPGVTIDRLYLWVGYIKDANDTVEFDFVMFLPEDEAIVQFQPFVTWGTGANNELVYDATADFPYIAFEDSSEYLIAQAQRGHLDLYPGKDNRLIFSFLDAAPDNAEWDISHFWAITVDYLPQFISPLE